jgi:hypothetical protein
VSWDLPVQEKRHRQPERGRHDDCDNDQEDRQACAYLVGPPTPSQGRGSAALAGGNQAITRAVETITLKLWEYYKVNE